MKNDYIQYVLATYILSERFDHQVGENWMLDDSYQDIARAVILEAFNIYEISVKPEIYDDHFHDIFSELVEGNGVIYDGDDYVDQWFKFILVKKNQILSRIIEANSAQQRLQRLGAAAPEALKRALDKITAEDQSVGSSASDELNSTVAENGHVSIPASDRVVSLLDNQKTDLEASTTELIETVEKQNGVDGDQSMKQQIVGQLKAGRELVRAGVFKLALIEQTILSVLGGLIEKYKNQAVGHAAKKLLDLLIEYVVGK